MRDRSSVPAAEQTAHPSAVRAGGRRTSSGDERAHAPFGGQARVDARPRLLSELARQRAAPWDGPVSSRTPRLRYLLC